MCHLCSENRPSGLKQRRKELTEASWPAQKHEGPDNTWTMQVHQPMWSQETSAVWKSQKSFLRTIDNDGVGEGRKGEQRIGNQRVKHGRGRTWYRQLTGTRLGLRSKYMKRMKFKKGRQRSMLTMTPLPLKPETACSWWILPVAVSTDLWYSDPGVQQTPGVTFVCSSGKSWNGCAHSNSYIASRKSILWQSFWPPLN